MKTINLVTPLNQTNQSDRHGAVAILAGFAAQYRGGNRLAQMEAAMIAVRMLRDGFTAATAIDSAARSATQ